MLCLVMWFGYTIFGCTLFNAICSNHSKFRPQWCHFNPLWLKAVEITLELTSEIFAFISFKFLLIEIHLQFYQLASTKACLKLIRTQCLKLRVAKVNNRYFNSNLAPCCLRINPFHLDLVSQCVLLCSRLVNATPLNLSQIWPQMKNLLGLNIKSQQMNQGCNLSPVYYLSTPCLSLDDTAWQTVICIVQNRFDVTAFSHLDSQKISFFFRALGSWLSSREIPKRACWTTENEMFTLSCLREMKI